MYQHQYDIKKDKNSTALSNYAHDLKQNFNFEDN